MTPTQLAVVAREITRRRGWRVQAVHQDGKAAFRVVLEHRRRRADLRIDLDRSFPRIHLDEGHAHAPGAPSPLASAMRGLLRAARLEGARTVPGERALVVGFERGGQTTTLWFEGFGRSANLYVVDPRGTVRLTPRGDVARRRGARVGDPFEPVPATEGPARDDAPEEGAGGSREVARQARAIEAGSAEERRRLDVLRALRRQAGRRTREVERCEGMAARGAEAERLQHEAELLQASFHRLEGQRGRVRVRIPDHTQDPPVEVEIRLDPRLGPGEQVGALFKAARKARRAGQEADRRLGPAREAHQALLGALEAAGQAEGLEALERIASEAGVEVESRRPAERIKRPQRQAWRTYLSSEGWPILVGRDARGNDRLTLHRARPQDLFLHVRGGSGGHVVVPTERGRTVPRDTLLEAAELAWWFSRRRKVQAPLCEVDYAPRRYVRKPKGSPPGTVVLERSRTLRLQPDEARLRRTLGTVRK